MPKSKPPRPDPTTPIVGPRILLRHPTARDRHEVMELKRASRAFLEPWEATPTDGLDMFSDEWFGRLLKMRRNDLHRRFVICLRGETGKNGAGSNAGPIVGLISLGNIARGAFQSCYLGYWIGQAYARRGYTTEAVQLILGLAFGNLGLHRVEANIVPRNKASRGLAKKLGFRCEGTAKRYLRVAGQWEDHEHWAMTAEEWAGPKSRTARTDLKPRARSPAST